MESQKRGKGRPKHIEKGANHNFWMPDDLWESIPKTKEKSKTTFICEAIIEKQKREEARKLEPENQEFADKIISLGVEKDTPLYDAILNYVLPITWDNATLKLHAIDIYLKCEAFQKQLTPKPIIYGKTI